MHVKRVVTPAYLCMHCLQQHSKQFPVLRFANLMFDWHQTPEVPWLE